MSNFIEKLSCSIHDLNCVAINLSQTTEVDNLILCVKCMADKLSLTNSVILNNDALQLLNEMKQKQYQAKKSTIEEQLHKIQTTIEKLQTYIDWLTNSFNKMLIQLKTEVEKYQSELKSMFEPKIENLEKSDLKMLLTLLQTNSSIPDQQTNQEEFNEFIKLVQKQLENLKTEDNIQVIINYLKQISKQEQIKVEQVTEQLQTKIEKITPALRFECNKHGKEIIMFTLDPEVQEERMLCVDCFPKFKFEVTTLEEANKMWLIHQGEVYDSNASFIRERQRQWKSIFDIINEYKEQTQKLQQDMIILLENKVEKIGKELQDLQLNKIKKQLMGLELNEIQDTINLLALKDQMSYVKQQQIKLKSDDVQYQSEIQKKLSEIEQIEISCKKKLTSHFDQSNQAGLDIFQLERINDQIKLDLDQNIFTVVIPNVQNKIFQALTEVCQNIIVKGQQYIEQLRKLNFKDKTQQQQLDINNYSHLLRQFEMQYKVKFEKVTQNTIPTQTNSNLKVQSSLVQLQPIQLKQTQQLFNISSKIISSSNQVTYPIYTKFNQPLKFSTTLKHSAITISVDGKTAQSSFGWQLCLCDQPIPKNGTAAVDFKVKQIQNIMAGICLKDSYNKDYTNSYSIGQGCYFLYNNSSVYSHHDPNKQALQQGFRFEQNDIISMEVNIQSKQISWRNKAKNHVYSVDIQTTSDLYFCFQLAGQSEIELV